MNITVERALQLIGQMTVEATLRADQIAALQNQLAEAELQRATAEQELAKLKPREEPASGQAPLADAPQ